MAEAKKWLTLAWAKYKRDSNSGKAILLRVALNTEQGEEYDDLWVPKSCSKEVDDKWLVTDWAAGSMADKATERGKERGWGNVTVALAGQPRKAKPVVEEPAFEDDGIPF